MKLTQEQIDRVKSLEGQPPGRGRHHHRRRRLAAGEYRAAINGVVAAIRKAGAIRFDLPAIATAEVTPEIQLRLCRLAERAVAMLDANLLAKAKAEAIHDVLDDDEDLVTLGVFARRVIDAYEARVR